MGVDIRGNFKDSKSYTTGAGLFAILRKNVAKAVLGDGYSLYTNWLETTEETPRELLHIHCKSLYDAAGDGVYNFLVQSDLKGKLTPKQVREVYERIKDSDYDYSLCYIFHRTPESKRDFINLLEACIAHRSGLKWY